MKFEQTAMRAPPSSSSRRSSAPALSAKLRSRRSSCSGSPRASAASVALRSSSDQAASNLPSSFKVTVLREGISVILSTNSR